MQTEKIPFAFYTTNLIRYIGMTRVSLGFIIMKRNENMSEEKHKNRGLGHIMNQQAI